jgi:hypothetical protein
MWVSLRLYVIQVSCCYLEAGLLLYVHLQLLLRCCRGSQSGLHRDGAVTVLADDGVA